MVIRRLVLDNWRGLRHFAMDFGPAINVLLGPNEAGKSSVVEAMDWALYRDITGARIPQDEIRSIIPASDPGAKPQVQVELEFHDCTATITKVLALESGKRECRLTIHRPAAAVEHFDRTEAQRRLRALFMADGLGEEKGNVAESNLLIAHQGEAASYLSDGSTAMRSTLGVGADGSLALTSRLERVRLQIENSRRRELTQDLNAEALESARASTEAAEVREKLAEARQKLIHFEAVEREMEALRDESAEIDSRLKAALEAESTARQQSEELSRTVLLQSEADKVVIQTEAGLREAESARNAAVNQATEVERLRREQAVDQERLDGCQETLRTSQENLDAQRETCTAILETQERILSELGDARQLDEAWRFYLAVFETRELQRSDARILERLETLSAFAQERQAEFDQLERCPSRTELVSWRSAAEDLNRLEREAGQSLQFELTPDRDGTLIFRRDNREAEQLSYSAGESVSLNALGEGEFRLPGFGTLRFRSGARGVEELRAAVDTARQSLLALLQPWGVGLENLTAALANFEVSLADFEAVQSDTQAAASAFKEAQQVHGTIEDLRRRVAIRQEEFEAAKRKCEPYQGLIQLGGLSRQEVKVAQEAAHAAARDIESRSNRARNDAATAQQRLRLAENEFSQASRLPDTIGAAMASRETQLARLEADGLSPEDRAKQVDDLAAALWSARQKAESARAARTDLGNAITTWQMDEARRALGELTAARSEDEKRLAEIRRDIWHHSGEDAGAQIQKLQAEIEELETRAVLHESRLRGLALLDAALKVERSRLGRALAGPLNEKLAPWLSALRGRETRLDFDESGSRIDSVTTKTESGYLALPFQEHSEGMKEQTALALRLLLATRVAQHLPSQRLAVILDDPFTQTDLTRREGMSTVLTEASGSLQIFLVSCHEDQIPPSLKSDRTWLGAEAPAPPASKPGPAKPPRAKKPEVAEPSLQLF